MSAADVQAEILNPMQRVFLPTRKMEPDDERMALGDYVKALQAFDADALSQAWGSVRDTHLKTSWPPVAAFVQAASRAAKDRSPGKRAPAGASDNERWSRWTAICRQPIAYDAVKRGVAWSLRCAVLNDGKEIHQISLQELTSRKRSAERLASDIESGRQVHHHGHAMTFSEENAVQAMSMWRLIAQRETETANEISRLSA